MRTQSWCFVRSPLPTVAKRVSSRSGKSANGELSLNELTLRRGSVNAAKSLSAAAAAVAARAASPRFASASAAVCWPRALSRAASVVRSRGDRARRAATCSGERLLAGYRLRGGYLRRVALLTGGG